MTIECTALPPSLLAVTEEIAGQGEVLASIVQMQQQTLSVLQSLKEQTEKVGTWHPAIKH